MMKTGKIDMEIIISRFLRIGMIVSAVIISIGMGMFLVTGKSGYNENFYPTSFNEILQGVISLKSYAVIMAFYLLYCFLLEELYYRLFFFIKREIFYMLK